MCHIATQLLAEFKLSNRCDCCWSLWAMPFSDELGLITMAFRCWLCVTRSSPLHACTGQTCSVSRFADRTSGRLRETRKHSLPRIKNSFNYLLFAISLGETKL
jgi:hypothetical protein